MEFKNRMVLWNCLYFFILIPLVLGNEYGFSSNNSTDNEKNITCTRDHEYDTMDIGMVMGKWKVIELYTHLGREGITHIKSCPYTTIWEVDDFPLSTFGPSTENQFYHVQHINAKFRHDYRHLRLLWDEAGHTIEYSLYFRNDSAGYWQVYDGQNGTWPAQTRYQQFSGTIQVLKAVNDHLVLNFCQEAANGKPAQLYSVLFSRDPGVMAHWEIDSIHNLLQNKKLSVASRRMVCGNGADRPFKSILFSVVLFAFTYALSVH